MTPAFKQDNEPTAFAPAPAALRLVAPTRPLPPSWMIAPLFRGEAPLAR